MIRNGFAEVTVPYIQRTYEYRLPPSASWTTYITLSPSCNIFDVLASDYKVEDRKISVDGGEITLRCLTPTPENAAKKTFPLMYWIHGGGMCFRPPKRSRINDHRNRMVPGKHRHGRLYSAHLVCRIPDLYCQCGLQVCSMSENPLTIIEPSTVST